jgi:hypothetical protein
MQSEGILDTTGLVPSGTMEELFVPEAVPPLSGRRPPTAAVPIVPR